ncbi:MAG: adenylyl-sulfate kinase [Calditrichaeota bacterium]|nr:MAG: adenylyl-sulfate kinase [Calditrichota bacterium]
MTDNLLHIHPVFDRMLGRAAKEEKLRQHAAVFWLTGLSGSGKSTLAIALENALFELGYLTQILDGDNIRSGINNNLGFSEDDRRENIRRIAEVARLFVQCGVITINSFVSPTRAMRQQAREIIGDDFYEIYVNAPLEVCEERDVKGLYKKARRGEIPNFTGIHQPYEAPTHPDLEINTAQQDLQTSLHLLLEFVLPIIRKKTQ